MIKSYLIKVKQETITLVTVEAESKQEAVERALRNEGDLGDVRYSDAEIVSIRCQDG